MLKKSLAVLALVLIVVLAACGGGKEGRHVVRGSHPESHRQRQAAK